jgi:hypothetical protein
MKSFSSFYSQHQFLGEYHSTVENDLTRYTHATFTMIIQFEGSLKNKPCKSTKQQQQH